MTKKYSISKIVVCLALFLGGISQGLLAQQVPLYQQYIYNRFVYNPAYTGFDDASNVNLIHRSQWLDMPGQPITTAITFDGPVKPKKIGLGVNMYSDKTDITNRLGVYGSFAYNIGIGDNQNLMFGLSLGGLQNRIDFSEVIVQNPDDPALLSSDQKGTGLDGTFGLGYRWKEFHLGVAIPQIMASKFEYDALVGNSRAQYNLARHYMASLEYKFFVNSAQDVSITPMFLVRYMPEAPMQFDGNLIFNWRETAFLAVSYRSDYAIGVNARVKINQSISFGYTYDIISSSISTQSGISHEILLGYSFGGGKVDESELEKLQERIDSLNEEIIADEQEVTQRYDELIAKADSLYQLGLYEEALLAYKQALALKPGEQYPQDKITEIESTKNSQYDEAIARADALFKARDYEGAKRAYEDAIKYKPGDAYAEDRITKIAKIENLFEKRYDALIKTADSLFMAKQYDLAKEKYSQASKFNPKARYAKDMISMIDNNQTGGSVKMVDSDDFVDEYGNKASKGFYVVMASFKSKENADGLKAKKGYQSVYNKVRGFHYVYMSMMDSYDGAKTELLNKARAEKPDSWIYILR